MKTELVVGDFETYWSDTHSLSKMSALEYVMSPKTELISLALKKEGKAVCWFGEKNIREGVSRIDWSNKLLVAHNNSEFDALIFAFRLGVKPRMWGCTLAMARPIHAKDVGGSLAALVEHYGLGKKDSSALIATKGKHLKDFTPEEIAAMRTYNMADTEQCYNLFYKLLAQTPKSEMQIIDATIRMLVEPQFVVDEPLLTKTLVLEQEHKRDMLISLAVKLGVGSVEDVRKTLASAPKFAALLTDNGVPVPMKLNPKGKSIPALAKTDEGFIALTEHENDLVAAAANTRLGVKSTQLETRIGKFLDAARHCNGRLPVPIKYYGADTTGRWSGFWYNCFPEGHEVLTPDGWVDISVWQPETPIMQWWPDGTLNWCTSAGKVEHQHNGDMVRLTGPFVRGLFTPDHRVPRKTATKVSDRTAGWIASHSGLDKVPASGSFVGGDSELTPDQVRFIVATSADGCFTKEGELRFGFRKQRKIDRLLELITSLGLLDDTKVYDYRGTPDNHWVLVMRRKAVPDWVRKGFGAWVLSLSRASLDALVEEVAFWDGSPHPTTGNTCFYTTSGEQAAWVSTALHLSRKPARIGERSKGRFDVYARSAETTSAKGSVEQFSGTVFCPQVESSYILVRHDGAIHVTGNCQNLPRILRSAPKLSDALRYSLMAPPGYKVVVADLSGIELRVNLTLWRVPYAMEMLAADPEADLYKPLASEVLGVPIEDMPKMVRQAGKAMHLGCFAPDTKVVTNNGVKRIVEVLATDMVWDGKSWVTHDGVVPHGWKAVQTQYGVTATADHEILTERGWVRWSEVCKSRRLFQSAIRKGSWSSLHGNVAPTPVKPGITRGFDVLAGGKDLLTAITLRSVHLLGVIAVPNRLRRAGTSVIGSMQTWFRTTRTALDYLTDCLLLLADVMGAQTRTGRTRFAVSQYAKSGAITGLSSYGTPSPSTDGTSRSTTWTESTTIKGTSRGIFGSLAVGITAITGALSQVCKKRLTPSKQNSLVYDLANCGSRHRFTVITDCGPILVHNCGFGLRSAEKYVGVARQMAQIVVTPEEAATHIAGYRAKHPEVVQGWKTCHRALDYVYSGNEAQIDPWGLCHTSKEGIVTPKGVIRYPDLRKEMNEDSGKVEWVYGTGRKKARIYGPKVDENIVQHLARNVLSDNMIEVRRQTEYWPVHTVHDELIYIVPEDQAQIMLDAVQAVMRTPPVWWPELVVYSEGSFGDNYGEAK
jgi:hypothetical protein